MKKTNKSLLGLSGVMLLSLTAIGCTSQPTETGPAIDPNKTYFQINQDDYKVTFNELRTVDAYACEANQKGDVKALVVPVDFTDYSAEALPGGAEKNREYIQKAIFGDPSTDPMINWESLHSFYNKSSYGQCNITGTVAPWFHTNRTAASFEDNYNVDLLTEDIYKKYTDYEGDGDPDIDLSDYDANNDGYVDLLLLVYACPTGVKGSNKDSSMYWAYTTQVAGSRGKGQDALKHGEEAVFSRYWFTSIEFMYNDNGINVTTGKDPNKKFSDKVQELIDANKFKVDAHTFIHETGHGLGLADYYSYDYNGDSPMGGVDMMDNNIGDHNAYSKSLYGWISPYVVEGSCEITIKPFEENGDAIMIPIREKDWRTNSYTLLDEYLILQYDTPTGLAKADGLDHYDNITQGPLYYSEPGIRILHTDSRMGLFSNNQDKDGKYVKTLVNYVNTPYLGNGDTTWTDFAHDNTATRSFNDCRLLEVVEPANNDNGYKDHLKGICTNDSLWKEGQILPNYHMNTVKDENTNTKYDLGFSIEIKSLTDSGATIKFTAK